MADSPLPPPPPPAPGQGAADAPLPPIEGATAPAAAKTPAAKKPAARKPAAAKAAPADAAAAPAAAPPAAPAATPAPAAVEPPVLSAAPVAPASPAPAAPAAVNPYSAAPSVAAPAAAAYSALPAAPSSTLSVLALVFGIMGLILSFFLLGLLPAIGGVILGHLALKREPHARGMAIAGLVAGYVGVAISLLWVLAILVPSLLFFFAVSGIGAGGFGG